MSADGEHWFLLNASPDVRSQLSCLPGPLVTGTRKVPIEGIVLTDAELDHTLGILLLREARFLQLYATAAVESVVERDSRILPVTRSFADVSVIRLRPGQETVLRRPDGEPSGIRVVPFSVPAGPPRFASSAEEGHTVGLIFEDESSGRSCAFVPGCGELTRAVIKAMAATDLVLFDGTFWSDDELIRLGISERSARQMDHLPVSGPGGSMQQLTQVFGPQKVYTHINNTNPMLLEDSPERLAVERAGLSIGYDGMSFTL